MHTRIAVALASAILSLSLPTVAAATGPQAPMREVAVTAVPGTLAVTVSPIPVLVTSESEREGSIRVDNISTLVEDVRIEVVDYSIDASGRPVPAPVDFEFGSASWYRFETTKFTLPSGRSRDIPFQLDIPVGAGAGDHFAALRVIVEAHEGEAQPAPDGASARSILVVESRLQHRIAGASPRTPTVDLTADAGSSAVQFTATVGNEGNTVVGHQAEPTPILSLYNLMPWADPMMAERVIAVRGFYVAPHSVRDVDVEWTDPPLFGQYRAVFVLPAADGQPKVVAETSFTVINVPVLLAIAIVILAGTFATVWMVRRGSGQRTRRAAKTASSS